MDTGIQFGESEYRWDRTENSRPIHWTAPTTPRAPQLSTNWSFVPTGENNASQQLLVWKEGVSIDRIPIRPMYTLVLFPPRMVYTFVSSGIECIPPEQYAGIIDIRRNTHAFPICLYSLSHWHVNITLHTGLCFCTRSITWNLERYLTKLRDCYRPSLVRQIWSSKLRNWFSPEYIV